MSNDVLVLENLTAVEIYNGDGMQQILDKIESEVSGFVPDLTTDKGRKAVATEARKVAKSKKILDDLGKELVSDWKTKAKAVDLSRKAAREFLDNLRDKVRQPLTNWEAEQKEIEAAEIRAKEEALRIEQEKREAEEAERKRKIEEQEAEIARLKQQAEQREREEQIRIEAEAKAKAEAEQEKIDAVNAERLKVEQAEQEKQDAINREKQAKIDAENARIESERQKEIAIKEAKEEAKREAERVENERKQLEFDEKNRIEAEHAEADRVEAERKARIENINAVNLEVENSLIKNGIEKGLARSIVMMLSTGKIARLNINY